MDVLDPECEGCGKRICVCPPPPEYFEQHDD
jgi:hypothetical protein